MQVLNKGHDSREDDREAVGVRRSGGGVGGLRSGGGVGGLRSGGGVGGQ